MWLGYFTLDNNWDEMSTLLTSCLPNFLDGFQGVLRSLHKFGPVRSRFQVREFVIQSDGEGESVRKRVDS